MSVNTLSTNTEPSIEPQIALAVKQIEAFAVSPQYIGEKVIQASMTNQKN